jgi:hypothetical protein
MKEVLFSAVSVLIFILISSAVAFNPLTVSPKKAQCRQISAYTQRRSFQHVAIRPLSTRITIIKIINTEEQAVEKPDPIALA